jgi:hypothetical protein
MPSQRALSLARDLFRNSMNNPVRLASSAAGDFVGVHGYLEVHGYVEVHSYVLDDARQNSGVEKARDVG